MLSSFSLISLLFHLLLFSLLCLSTAPIANHAKKQPLNNMVFSEAETLFTIMESMSSDQKWRISHPTPCQSSSSWPGIECKIGKDNNFHVSRLDFGTYPNPICKKTATFPSLIFSLPYLQSAFFFNCFTISKTSLSFSPAMSMTFNSSLQQLSLRSNPALSGPIPPRISSLKSLQVLTLSQNSLSGPIPLDFSGLNSLLHLDLSYNMLSGSIPYEMGNLKSLIGLDLSYNLLSGSVPTTIGQLDMLQKLDLSSNSLTGSIPDSIKNLKSLVFLAMSNNRLHGNFPVGLEKLQSLQYFIMDDNPMNAPLPLELGKLVKLQELRVANSGYSGAIPETFAQLMNLSTLSLQNNNLTGSIPAGFGDFLHIFHLNLSRNFLGGIVPFDSSFIKRLGRNLDLSGNPDLCLNPSQASIIKIGVEVCRDSITDPFVKPRRKSIAASSSLPNHFLLVSSVILIIYILA